MLPFILFALFQVAYSLDYCQQGTRLLPEKLQSPKDAVGNWTYVYHWDNDKSYDEMFRNFLKENKENICSAPLEISVASLEYNLGVKTKCAEECKKNKWDQDPQLKSMIDLNYKLQDAKLKFNGPSMSLIDAVLIMEDGGEVWLMQNCLKMPLVILKISEDFLLVTNKADPYNAEFFTRKNLSLEQLRCAIKNVDLQQQNLNGFEVCI